MFHGVSVELPSLSSVCFPWSPLDVNSGDTNWFFSDEQHYCTQISSNHMLLQMTTHSILLCVDEKSELLRQRWYESSEASVPLIARSLLRYPNKNQSPHSDLRQVLRWTCHAFCTWFLYWAALTFLSVLGFAHGKRGWLRKFLYCL